MQPAAPFHQPPRATAWYHQKWFVILTTILVFPVGLYLLWTSPKTKTIGRIVWSVVGLFAVLVIIGANAPANPPQASPKQSPKGVPATPVAAAQPKAVPATPTAPAQPKEKTAPSSANSGSTPAPAKIKLTATATVAANGSIQVKGDTNLPAGTIITAQALDAQGHVLGDAPGTNVQGGAYQGSIALVQAVDGELRVRVSLDPWPGQPAATRQLIGEHNEKLKDIVPDGFILGPNVYTNMPSAYVDLKVTVTMVDKITDDRRIKVLADAKKIGAVDVQMDALTQQANEIWSTYLGRDNPKGRQLIDPVYSQLDYLQSQVDGGSAVQNLAPEVLPYATALTTESVAKLNAVGKCADALSGSKDASPISDFNAATAARSQTEAAMGALAKRLNITTDEIMGR